MALSTAQIYPTAQLYRIFLTLFILCFSSLSYAFHIPAQQASKETPLNLTVNMQYQFAPEEIGIKEMILDPDWHHNWETHTKPSARFSINGQTLWLSSVVKNTYDKTFSGVVDIGHTSTDEINVYFVDRNTNRVIKHATAGSNYQFTQREQPYRTFAFAIDLAPNQEVEIYIKVHDSAHFYGDICFWEAGSFHHYKSQYSVANGITLGILLIVAMLCTMIYINIKESAFFYYGMFLVSYALVYAIQNGIAFQILWPNSPELNQVSITIASGLTLLFLCFFASFPRQENPSGFINALRRSAFVIALLIIFSPVLLSPPQQTLFLSFGSLIAILFNALSSFITSWKQKHNTKAYALVWGLFLISVSLLILNRHGYIDYRVFIEHFTLSGILLSTFLLTNTITETFYIQRKSRDTQEQRSQALDALKNYYSLYQNSVEGIFTCTLDGQLISANETFIHALGFKNYDEVKAASAKQGLRQLLVQDKTEQDHRTDLLERTINTGFVEDEEIEVVRKDKRRLWLAISLKVVPTSDEKQIYIHGTAVDITKKHHVNQQMTYVSTHDVLTGTLNRQEIEKRILSAIRNFSPIQGAVTIIYLDIHRLNLINESCGHTAGDSLLRQISEQIKSTIRDVGELGRVSSDEFAILLPDKNSNEGFAVAYRIVEAVKALRFVWENNVFTVSVSVGMTHIDSRDKDVERVLAKAEAACKIAKDKGQNRIHIYSDDEQPLLSQKSEPEWINILNDAIDNDKFCLFFQIIYPTKHNDAALCYEILLKLKKDDGSYIASSVFIPLAERYDLIREIDRWVIDHYFRWLAQHPEHQQQLNFASINISGASAIDSDFHVYLYEKIVQYDIDASKICFEITEKSAIVNLSPALNFIGTFKKHGCKFSLDDFGSGFSSYGYLKNLPVDFIKIDGEFVRDLLTDPIDKAMVNSINSVAQAIGKLTIAEAVENEEQKQALQELGVDYMQGRYWHTPAPLHQINRFVPSQAKSTNKLGNEKPKK